jgi:phosphoribosyl-ATP pyrophosphohydrolase/phosphoribosyl-AMP cyclohydrolase
MNNKINKVNFDKMGGLVPAIVQDYLTSKVLMLGFMNKEAMEITQKSGKVCFFSRTKNRLWTKGEESGNYLTVIEQLNDCDNDTILFKVKPAGPVCHKGSDTCWGEENTASSFIYTLENILEKRKSANPSNSYTAQLFEKGINKIAQKVGEEAVELVIEAKDNSEELFLNEAADLMYHYLVLLKFKGYSIKDVENILISRHS